MGFLILGIHSRLLYEDSGEPHSFGGPIKEGLVGAARHEHSFGGPIMEGLVGAARRVTVSKNRAGRPIGYI